MPARRLGRWEVLARLATGSSGHVLLARRPRLDGFAAAALKIPVRNARPEQLEAIRAEAKLLAELDHPAIVEVFELVPEPAPFLVMELVVGERLDRILALARESGQPVPPALAATIAQTLLDALHHAHQRIGTDDAAHRDVSPPNVIVTYEGQTKLLDFSIAQHDKAYATLTGLIRGRPGYMSPEQLTGGRVDLRTDVYAVGVLLWEMLANDRLRGELEPGQVAWAQQRPPPPLAVRAPGVPPMLAEIVDQALRKEPDDRFASAASMSRALGRYLDDCTLPWGKTALAKMLLERFPRRRAERQSVLTGLERGPYDEARLFAAFDARAVMALDLPEATDAHTLAQTDVPLGGPETLESDPADSETVRGGAQGSLQYEDVTEASGDEATVLDAGAQALVFAADPAPTIEPVPMRPPTPSPLEVDTDPEPDPEPTAAEDLDAPTRDDPTGPTVLPPVTALAPTHVPEIAPTAPGRLEIVDPTPRVDSAALRRTVEGDADAEGAPTRPPAPSPIAHRPDPAVPPAAASSDPTAPPPVGVQPRGPTDVLPATGGRAPLASWQFWLVLIVGLLVGVAGGAALTWTLIGG